jgi:hypothetical protein
LGFPRQALTATAQGGGGIIGGHGREPDGFHEDFVMYRGGVVW